MCEFSVHPSNWWVVLKSTHLFVGFLVKIWMLGNWFNHAFISFFFELSFVFLYHEVSYHCEITITNHQNVTIPFTITCDI
jgi:hypothetical protein